MIDPAQFSRDRRKRGGNDGLIERRQHHPEHETGEDAQDLAARVRGDRSARATRVSRRVGERFPCAGLAEADRIGVRVVFQTGSLFASPGGTAHPSVAFANLEFGICPLPETCASGTLWIKAAGTHPWGAGAPSPERRRSNDPPR